VVGGGRGRGVVPSAVAVALILCWCLLVLVLLASVQSADLDPGDTARVWKSGRCDTSKIPTKPLSFIIITIINNSTRKSKSSISIHIPST